MSQLDCLRGRDWEQIRCFVASSAHETPCRKRNREERKRERERERRWQRRAKGGDHEDRSVRTIAKEIIAASFRTDKRPLHTIISTFMLFLFFFLFSSFFSIISLPLFGELDHPKDGKGWVSRNDGNIGEKKWNNAIKALLEGEYLYRGTFRGLTSTSSCLCFFQEPIRSTWNNLTLSADSRGNRSGLGEYLVKNEEHEDR